MLRMSEDEDDELDMADDDDDVMVSVEEVSGDGASAMRTCTALLEFILVLHRAWPDDTVK